MTRALSLRNRQPRPLDRVLLRRIVRTLLTDLLQVERFDLGLVLVGPAEMTRLNQTFLGHAGSTDVVTFNYAERPSPQALHGEIVVCVEEALTQARRFRTAWPAELVRYLVHGVLHLQGHDDAAPGARRRMKRAEDRLLRQLRTRFDLSRLPGASRLRS